MDAAMFQLRSFVHQRLYTAAEEILGEVQKTITLAVYEAEVGRSKEEEEEEEEEESLRHRRDFLQNQSAALTSSSVKHGDECDAPLLQENPAPSTPEESSSSLGASQTRAGPDNTNWNHCLVRADLLMSEIKEEQEELGDDGQTQEMFIPSPEIVKSEQDQPETQVSHDMPPVSSDGSAAQSENDEEELVNSKGGQTKTTRRKGTTSQGQSGSSNEKEKGTSPTDKSSDKSEKGRSFCHFCGKGFQYIGSLMKHIKTHENNLDCTVCGVTCLSSNELITHVEGCHNKTYFCDICGKTFANIRCLRLHERIHTGKKEFVCQECGKTFYRREHLIVHVRTHSGEKPYHCDICGKAFSQSQNLTIHKRSHSGEKPYQCGLCGKLFNTSSHLKTHMRYHSGEKPYPCDICGKRFSQSGQMTRHRTTHTGERPYGCRVCGMRYRFAPNLKVHMQTHEKASNG
ncbi:zinc finger protein with KRAB and SCAN domains 8-like isoform X1 [Anoplopoma fimbria]|uniref:zinc finger protein with KRAB and SCAN domains 8-like isoform X1 n=1 Tax=Anoplopoma fimbria TaxID=229290 RepID=UPI0023ED19DE|nr:zinc finger protein with KRAB and SCAN domains 8-like isoform X1 [Anoplopoma fimbria]